MAASSSNQFVEKNRPLVSRKRRGQLMEPEFPVEPTVIQQIKTPRGTMNHSYRDFSRVPAEADYEHPTEIDDMSFAQKIHHILSNVDYAKWISWMPHGRTFRIHVPVMLESQVCPVYFHHRRYSTFLRELNNYGFKHITQGPDRNCYYHEFMLKDRPHLCQYMPLCKDARRLHPDPTHEPDFYRISQEYPLDRGISSHNETFDDNPVATKCARLDDHSAHLVAKVDSKVATGSFSARSNTDVLQALESITDVKVLLAILEAKQKRQD